MTALKEKLILVGFGAVVAGAVAGAIIVGFGAVDVAAPHAASPAVAASTSAALYVAGASPTRDTAPAQRTPQQSTPRLAATMPPPALVDLILSGEAAEVPGQDPRFGAYRRALEARASELRMLPTSVQTEEIARIKGAIFSTPPKVGVP
jgi:hypothetical protein